MVNFLNEMCYTKTTEEITFLIDSLPKEAILDALLFKEKIYTLNNLVTNLKDEPQNISENDKKVLFYQKLVSIDSSLEIFDGLYKKIGQDGLEALLKNNSWLMHLNVLAFSKLLTITKGNFLSWIPECQSKFVSDYYFRNNKKMPESHMDSLKDSFIFQFSEKSEKILEILASNVLLSEQEKEDAKFLLVKNIKDIEEHNIEKLLPLLSSNHIFSNGSLNYLYKNELTCNMIYGKLQKLSQNKADDFLNSCVLCNEKLKTMESDFTMPLAQFIFKKNNYNMESINNINTLSNSTFINLEMDRLEIFKQYISEIGGKTILKENSTVKNFKELILFLNPHVLFDTNHAYQTLEIMESCRLYSKGSKMINFYEFLINENKKTNFLPDDILATMETAYFCSSVKNIERTLKKQNNPECLSKKVQDLLHLITAEKIKSIADDNLLEHEDKNRTLEILRIVNSNRERVALLEEISTLLPNKEKTWKKRL